MYGHIARAVFDAPWAIVPGVLETIAGVVRIRIAGGRLDDAEIQARVEAAAAAAGPRGGARVSGAVAVIPVYGVLMQRASLMSRMSGGTSVEDVAAAFRAAMADSSVGSIVLDFDSPGGEVGGIPELAAEILASRERKPVAAVANTLCASAAYWLASQCDEVVATPSSLVGSIGVYTVHEDHSAELEARGVKPTIVSAGRYKVEGNPTQPLSEEALAALQQTCDDYYGLFTRAVAKGRQVPVADVLSGYGEGRVLTAQRAKAAGLVDRVATLEDTIVRASQGRIPIRGEAVGGGRPLVGIRIPADGTWATLESDGPGEALPIAAAAMPDCCGEGECPDGCSGCGDCPDCTGDSPAVDGACCGACDPSARKARASAAVAIARARAQGA